MFKRTILGLVILGPAGVAAMVYSPALRTTLHKSWADHLGWNKGAQDADPGGFANHAQEQLQKELAAMQQTRHELAAEVDRLDREIQHQTGLAHSAAKFAEQFRAALRDGGQRDAFPIELRGAAYTHAQAEAQIRLLLAEAESCREAAEKLDEVRTTTQAQVEGLVVRIGQTDAQFAGISARSRRMACRPAAWARQPRCGRGQVNEPLPRAKRACRSAHASARSEKR